MSKYRIIYADPPWKPLESGTGVRGTADLKKRYSGVMKVEEICALPIKEICEDDAMLFLWATFPRLQEAMQVIEAWGFRYYGLGFNWVKLNKKSDTPFWGMGYYTRQNSEICLIGVKEGRQEPQVRNIHSVVMTKVEEHSKKPECVKDYIVEILGDIPRIELFARDKTDGWDVWGNEIESDVTI